MANSDPLSFEEKLQAAVQMPQPRPEFLSSLRARLVVETPRPLSLGERLGLAFRRPAWIAGMVALMLVVSFLIAGPQRVFAAVRGLLGYIPGVGIVDSSAPMRVLAEPVIAVQKGIAVTVTSAVLTADRTHIEYRIFGVPGSAYPTREDVQGCIQSDYLRLPDGIQLDHLGGDFQPVPANVNEATLVIPCIFNTLPNTVPENWEISLRFVPAPPNMTVMPVVEVSPSPETSPTEAAASPAANNSTATPPAENAITVQKVIETADGYILVGKIRIQGTVGQTIRMNGGLEIRDASGKTVNYTRPTDVTPDVDWGNPNESGWAVQFKAAGLAYPLTLSVPGNTLSQPDPNASAEFEFDAGPDPKMGQEYSVSQDIQLLGHTLKLYSINVDSRNGYQFWFNIDPQVDNFDLKIEGYNNTGWGGSGVWDGKITRSLSYANIPTGKLKVIVSNLTFIGDSVAWTGQWSPASPRTDLPANPTPQPGLCLTQDTINQISQLPANLAQGKALFYEQIDGTEKWGLVLYNLDGSGRQVVVPEGNWGALSPDGKQVAYSGIDNAIHIVEVDTGAEQVLPKASGFNIHWSPDGKQLGYIHLGGGVVDSAAIANVDGTQAKQVSTLSYETIIGWSPEGARLYFAAPYTGGAAWKVFGYEASSAVTQELFTIENGTPKFLNPKLSPDGQWIAYRGRDNSSVYLVHPDGSGMRLLADSLGATGIEWSHSGWLGISLAKQDSSQSKTILVKPDSCEIYQLPDALHGELQGLYLP